MGCGQIGLLIVSWLGQGGSGVESASTLGHIQPAPGLTAPHPTNSPHSHPLGKNQATPTPHPHRRRPVPSPSQIGAPVAPPLPLPYQRAKVGRPCSIFPEPRQTRGMCPLTVIARHLAPHPSIREHGGRQLRRGSIRSTASRDPSPDRRCHLLFPATAAAPSLVSPTPPSSLARKHGKAAQPRLGVLWLHRRRRPPAPTSAPSRRWPLAAATSSSAAASRSPCLCPTGTVRDWATEVARSHGWATGALPVADAVHNQRWHRPTAAVRRQSCFPTTIGNG